MKKACIFWFTGLSGAGKSTVACLAKKALEDKGLKVAVVDGDEVRAQYGFPIGFTPEEIKRNNSFIVTHCEKIRSMWDVILVPVISPFRESRDHARKVLGAGFYEIYLDASLETVTSRDTKGLYQKAKEGKLDNLIGVCEKTPYEAPLKADLVLKSGAEAPETSAGKLCDFIGARIDARVA
jgi:adenylyl-sulfate kinase